MFEKSQEEPPIDLYDDKLPPSSELLSGCNLLIFEMRNVIDLNPVPHDQNTSERGGKNMRHSVDRSSIV